MTAKAAMKPGSAERCIDRDEEISSMDPCSKPSETYPSVMPGHLVQSDLKIALQSALAAGLCLGLPAGLFFWLISGRPACEFPSGLCGAACDAGNAGRIRVGTAPGQDQRLSSVVVVIAGDDGGGAGG